MSQNEAIRRLDLTGTSQKSSVEIRKLPNKRYEFIFFVEDKKVFQQKVFGGSPDNDKLVDMLAGSGIDFISFSAIATAANDIENITRAMELLDIVADEYIDDQEPVASTKQGASITTTEDELSSDLDKQQAFGATMSEEEGIVRMELPMAAGAIAEARLLDDQNVELIFFQESNKIHSQVLSNPNNEALLDLLAISGVEFTSISAISQAADDLEQKIAVLRSIGIKQEPSAYVKSVSIDEKDSEDQITADELAGEVRTPVKAVDDGTFLTDVKVPYSPGSLISVYQLDVNFNLVFKQEGNVLSSSSIKADIDEDELTIVISNSGMNFIGMTVILDCAEAVLDVIQNPDKYLVTEKIADETTGDHIETVEETVEKKEEEEDINLEEYRTPADIENLIVALKKSVDQNKPTLMKELDVKVKAKGVTTRIFRQGEDTWYFQVFQKGESISNMMKLNSVDQDEVFRVLNNGVPQTSLSELASAAESVYNELKVLASQSQDDLILTQVVGHFSKIIEDHEKNKKLDQARELSKSLLEKFKKLNNAEGISKFGQKTAAFYESQGRLSESAQLRVELVDYLLENLQNLNEAKEFVDSTLDFLVNDPLNRYMDAAELCIKFTDTCIERKDLLLGVGYAQRSSAFYKEANLPFALTDTCFKYGKLFLDLVFEPIVKEEKITKEEEVKEEKEKEKDTKPTRKERFVGGGFSGAIRKKKVKKKEITRKKGRAKKSYDPKDEEKKFQEMKEKTITGVVELFKTALEVQESRKDKFELVEGITNIILWMREKKLVDEEIIFSEKAINYFDDFHHDERSLKLTLQLIPKLFESSDTEKHYPKALDLSNKVIRMYMENSKLKNLERAIDFCMQTVDKLIELKQRDAAVGYMNFAQNLIPKAFTTKKMLNQKLKLIMALSSSFQKLQMTEESLAEIKKALEIKKNQGAKELVDFVKQHSKDYIEKELLQAAHDLINTSITLIGPSDLPTVIRISNNFAEDLFPSKNYKLALDYITYAYTQSRSLQNADPQDAIKNIVHFTMLFLEDPNVEKVTDYVNQLIPVFIQYYQYTKEIDHAISTLSKVIDHLIERKDFKDAARYTKDLGNLYSDKGDFKAATDALINYRDSFISQVIDEAKEITDVVLDWCVNQLKDFKTAISITESLVVELIKKGQHEDAYIYTIQCSKYYETINDISGATEFLSRICGAYGENFDFVERVADFSIRLNKGHKRTQEAVDIAVNNFKEFTSKQKPQIGIKFLDKAIKLLISEDKQEKAIEILKNAKRELLEQKFPEIELIVESEAQVIKEWRIKYKEWKADEKIKDLLVQSANECLNTGLVEVADRLMSRCVIHVKNSDAISDLIPLLENWIERLYSKEEYKRSKVYVIEIINKAFQSEEPQVAQETAFKYITSYLDQGQVDLASELVENINERNRNNTAQLIRITFRFVKQLVELSLVSSARKYIDKSTEIFAKPSASREEVLAAGKFCEKFASLVIKESKALALEYVYKAGDYYKRIQDIDSLIKLYKNISMQLGGKTGLKTIKRGLFTIENMTVDAKKIFELHQVHVKMLIESKERDSRVKIGIQKLLDVTESLDSLETLAGVVNEMVIDLAKHSLFDIIMVYFEYLINLINMIGKSSELKIVFTLTKNYFQEIGNKEEFIKKIDDAYEKLSEPEPKPEEIETFFLSTEEKERLLKQREEERLKKIDEEKEIIEEEEIEREIMIRGKETIIQSEKPVTSDKTAEALSSLLELEDTEEEYQPKAKKTEELEESEDEDFEISLVGGSLKELESGTRHDISSLLETDSEEEESEKIFGGSLTDLVSGIRDEIIEADGEAGLEEDVFKTRGGFLDVKEIVKEVTSKEERVEKEVAVDEYDTKEDDELSIHLVQSEIVEKNSSNAFRALEEDEEDFDSEFTSIFPGAVTEKKTTEKDQEKSVDNQDLFSSALDDLDELGDKEEKGKKKKTRR
ncbi:MAG: hypothetical protein ACXAEU_03405 [Candidatus Hodarchaeales archaeon]|jgi:hypothetical protein